MIIVTFVNIFYRYGEKSFTSQPLGMGALALLCRGVAIRYRYHSLGGDVQAIGIG